MEGGVCGVWGVHVCMCVCSITIATFYLIHVRAMNVSVSGE